MTTVTPIAGKRRERANKPLAPIKSVNGQEYYITETGISLTIQMYFVIISAWDSTTSHYKFKGEYGFLSSCARSAHRSLVQIGEVRPQVLGHSEGFDLLISEDLGHLLVRGEVLLVLRVLDGGWRIWLGACNYDDRKVASHLKIVLLEVGPKELHELCAGRHLLTDDVGELGAELLRCLESCSRHDAAIVLGLGSV